MTQPTSPSIEEVLKPIPLGLDRVGVSTRSYLIPPENAGDS
jgi:hypothetical protein